MAEDQAGVSRVANYVLAGLDGGQLDATVDHPEGGGSAQRIAGVVANDQNGMRKVRQPEERVGNLHTGSPRKSATSGSRVVSPCGHQSTRLGVTSMMARSQKRGRPSLWRGASRVLIIGSFASQSGRTRNQPWCKIGRAHV